jgi:hypothetical protein
MCVDDEVAWQWGNGGIRSLTMVVRRSAVVGGGLHNRRENVNEEEGVNSRRGAQEGGAH